MITYVAVVDKDADSAFGIWFPDLPDCFSAADRREDIVRNATEALSLYLVDQDHPPARSADEIARGDDVAASLRDGAYLLGIPLKIDAQ